MTFSSHPVPGEYPLASYEEEDELVHNCNGEILWGGRR